MKSAIDYLKYCCKEWKNNRKKCKAFNSDGGSTIIDFRIPCKPEFLGNPQYDFMLNKVQNAQGPP